MDVAHQGGWAVVLWLALLLPGLASAATPSLFPYVPTTVLVPSNTSNTSTVYIFAPDGGTSGQVDLLALDVTARVQAAAVGERLKTLTAGVPFLPDHGQASITTTFVPTLLANGSLLVYAGACGSTGATAWMYGSSGSWTNQTVDSTIHGPGFLGGGQAFSTQLAPTVSAPVVYLYGGMCPANTSSGTADTWQANATYSNQMTKLISNTTSGSGYATEMVASKGPPIAEAGFSLTPLAPSLANRSGVVTQQVNSVVLGGHTRTAFINMSTAAVWTLPEEAWSFVSIRTGSSSSSSSSTELAVRATTPPDSRSGHSAVLSADGSALVVLGGWVGDVSQAASPQLAVLEMGADYGQWQWSIPTNQPSGSGIYGHGAALLPGNVMMVYGGYNISNSSAVTKRDTSGSLLFLNLTSLSWISEYTNPTTATTTTTTTTTTTKSSTSTGHSSAKRIGLGVGLGIGLPLLMALVALCFCCCRRRQKKRREARRQVLAQTIAQDNAQFLQSQDDMVEVSHGEGSWPLAGAWNPRTSQDVYTGGLDPYHVDTSGSNSNSNSGYESMRGQPAYGGPSIVRKPSRQVARGLYQPTTISDYETSLAAAAAAATVAAGENGSGHGHGGGSGHIHPIYEADEEEEEDDEDDDDEDHTMKAVAALGRDPPHRLGTATTTGRSISPETAEEASINDPFLTPLTARGGGFAPPMTVNLNPFVRNTPSPDAGLYHRSGTGASPSAATTGSVSTGSGGPLAAPQDRDVQEWVAGLEIEDLLFAPPAPGAVTLAASPAPTVILGAPTHQQQQRGRLSPAAVGHRASHRSKTSSSSTGSPTRGSFFGVALGAGGSGNSSGDDEARTTSNLSDRSAFSFLTRTGSSRSRLAVVTDGRSNNNSGSGGNVSDSGNSYNTALSAPPGFHALRAEAPGLLYGRRVGPALAPAPAPAPAPAAPASSLATSSIGDSSRNNSMLTDSVSADGGFRQQQQQQATAVTITPAGPGPFRYGHVTEYGGAAAALAAGAGGAAAAADYAYGNYPPSPVRDGDYDNEHTALTGGGGSPSKARGHGVVRRSWMGSILRIFSGSGAPGSASSQEASSLGNNSSSEVIAFHGKGESSSGVQVTAPLGLQHVRDRAHATLLRRKQGRFDWEADSVRDEENTAVGAIHGRTTSTSGPADTSGEGANPGSVAAGRRDGSGKSDDWDVEKALQGRVVQVMFTVPRDQQLRVVNAEVEREEEEAEIVNPDAPAPAPEKVPEPEKAEKALPPTPPPPSPPPPILGGTAAQEKQLRDLRAALKRSNEMLRAADPPRPDAKGKEADQTIADDDATDDTIDADETDDDWVLPRTTSRPLSRHYQQRPVTPPSRSSAAVPPLAVTKPLNVIRPARSAHSIQSIQSATPAEVAAAYTPARPKSPAKEAGSHAPSHAPIKIPSAASLTPTRRSMVLEPPRSGSPASSKSAARRSAGYVLDMVEQIETSSRSSSPTKF